MCIGHDHIHLASNTAGCGVRTHAHLSAGDLKSPPLTTRANQPCIISIEYTNFYKRKLSFVLLPKNNHFKKQSFSPLQTSKPWDSFLHISNLVYQKLGPTDKTLPIWRHSQIFWIVCFEMQKFLYQNVHSTKRNTAIRRCVYPQLKPVNSFLVEAWSLMTAQLWELELLAKQYKPYN